jgi:hypothetical protein
MEVWVLEAYYSEEGTSDTLGVYENSDVAMNQVINVTWKQYDTYRESNKVNGIIYYVLKFEVILDEIPIVRN